MEAFEGHWETLRGSRERKVNVFAPNPSTRWDNIPRYFFAEVDGLDMKLDEDVYLQHVQNLYYDNTGQERHPLHILDDISLIPKDTVKNLRESTKVILDSSGDGVWDLQLLLYVEEIFGLLDIDVSKIWYLTDAMNSQKLYEKILGKKSNINFIEDINILLVSTFISHFKQKDWLKWKSIAINFEKRDKKFIFLNRYPKIDRALALSMLHKNNLLDSGYWSCVDKINYWFDTLHIQDRGISATVEYKWKWLESLGDKKVKELLDYFKSIDISGTEIRTVKEPAVMHMPELYDNSYFHFLGESYIGYPFEYTRYKENNIDDSILQSFSEKICKPLFYKQPFIAHGRSGLYKLIKSLGFETYDDIVDESFDTETNTVKRSYKFAKECYNIASMPIDDLHEYYINNTDKIIHNKQLFVEKISIDARKKLIENILNKIGIGYKYEH